MVKNFENRSNSPANAPAWLTRLAFEPVSLSAVGTKIPLSDFDPVAANIDDVANIRNYKAVQL